MPLGLLFWMIFVIAFIFGLWGKWPNAPAVPPYVVIGGGLLEFVLIFLLGWRVFGFVIQG